MINQSQRLSELWNQVCLGDQKAYASIHFQLYPGLYNYSKSIVKDDDEANDLIQDLFVKLWTKKLSIGKIVNVKAYFYSAARSVSINHLRSLKMQQSKMAFFNIEEFQFSIEDTIIMEEHTEKRKITIQNALKKLPPKQREIIYLSFFESLNHNQIAEITGIKYQSVVNHVYRAIQFLRCQFETANSKVAA